MVVVVSVTVVVPRVLQALLCGRVVRRMREAMHRQTHDAESEREREE